MASAFWTFEDGRVLARQWAGMAFMLKLITDELNEIKGAEEFHKYLKEFVFSEEDGDIYNGFGGFIRENKNIMFNLDLRTYAPQNRKYFWQATQNALTKLKVQKVGKNEWVIFHFTKLLDMYKRIKKGEDPRELNDIGQTLMRKTNEQLGPGW